MKTSNKQLLRFIGWFFFANACLFFLVSFSYLFDIVPFALTFPTTFNKILVGFFVAVTMLGHFTFLAFLPALLIVPFVFIIKKFKYIQILSIVIATFSFMMLCADAFVFKQFHYHINGIILQMLFSKEFSEVFELALVEWFLIAGLIVFILLMQTGLAFFVKKLIQKKSQLHGKGIAVSLGTLLFFSYEIFLLGGVNTDLSLTQQARAFPLFNNIISLVVPLPDSLMRVEKLACGHFVQLKNVPKPLRYPIKPLKFKTIEKPLNVLIIVIDAWRFDMLDPVVTPQLYAFSKRAWQFTNHWSGGNCTQAGIFSLFYGLPGTYWSSMLDKRQGPLLINSFLDKGYQTGIYASAELVMPAFHQTAFVNIPNLAVETPGETPYARDQMITKKFFNFLNHAQKDKPFFSFLFYDSAHAYCTDGNPIQKFRPSIACLHYSVDKNTDPTPIFNRYKNALAFIDIEVGKVIQQLHDQKRLENTIILVTGDHGQEFNDNHNNYWEHAGNYTKFQVQTPLLIYWPHQKPAKYSHWTSHFDIAPTLMHKVLGCSNPASDFCVGRFILGKHSLSHLVISSYVDFGIVEPDQITTVYSTGNYAIHDPQYQLMTNNRLRLQILRQAFLEINQFYR